MTLDTLRIVYICMDMNSIPSRTKDSKTQRRRTNETICHHYYHHSSLKESGYLVQNLSKIQATILGNLQITYFIRQLLFFTSRQSATRVVGQISVLHYYIKEMTGNGNRQSSDKITISYTFYCLSGVCKEFSSRRNKSQVINTET